MAHILKISVWAQNGASTAEHVKGRTSGTGNTPHFVLEASAAGSAQVGRRLGGALGWQPRGEHFRGGRWIQSTLPLGFYPLPSLSMLQSSSCRIHHKENSDPCWILASIVINKINSLRQKKCHSFHGSTVDVISLGGCKNGCLLPSKIVFCGAAVLRGWERQRLYLAALSIMRDPKISWKSLPFPRL